MTIQSSLGISSDLWGIIISVMCIILVCAGKKSDDKKSLVFILFLLTNATELLFHIYAIAYRAELLLEMPFGLTRVAFFGLFQMGYLMPLLFILYMKVTLQGRGIVFSKGLLIAEILAALAGTFCIILTQFNHLYYYFDEAKLYHTQSGYVVSMVVGMIESFIILVAIIYYWKRLEKVNRYAFLSYFVLPFVAIIIHVKVSIFDLANTSITISLLLIFYAYIREMADTIYLQKSIILQKEQEEVERKYQILRSQIEPHFLFNTLSSICAVCEDQNAVKILQNFARYVRMNIDAVNRDEMIPFSHELEHVNQYLQIEKLRFEDKLQINMDIKEDNFMLPPLVLETLVENAVKHGISKKRGGGILTITSDSAALDGQEYYRVIVTDNGSGFDPEEKLSDDRSHIGLNSARTRIESRCKGKLIVESTKDIGTKITVLIPRTPQ